LVHRLTVQHTLCIAAAVYAINHVRLVVVPSPAASPLMRERGRAARVRFFPPVAFADPTDRTVQFVEQPFPIRLFAAAPFRHRFDAQRRDP
jgi:hypothetical protein